MYIFNIQFISPNPTDVQEFGFSVAMSEKYVVVGAPGDDMMATENGMAYVYALSNNEGQLSVDLDASFMPMALTANSRFGASVAIYDGSDDVNVPENILSEWIAIGAPGLNVSGMVFVYVKINDNDIWSLLGKVWSREPSSSDFGHSVAWYNDYMVRLVSKKQFLCLTFLLALGRRWHWCH